MKLGIVGLPLAGKTTIFNALTGAGRPTGPAPPGKLEVHTATVDVPDPRLDQLHALFSDRKQINAQITYADIAGLDKGVGRTGLSGAFRAQLSQMDGLLHVVRLFDDPTVPHPYQTVDPQRDLETLDGEFLLADLVVVESHLERIADDISKGRVKRDALARERTLFEQLRDALEANAPLRDLSLGEDEAHSLRGYGFLTQKPTLVLLNAGDESPDPTSLLDYQHARSALLAIQGRLEVEIAQLDEDEAALFRAEYGIEQPARERVIRTSYALVGLQSFFTIGDDEVRAWTIPVGTTAFQAAGEIHTDIQRGFIRAEVIRWDELQTLGGLSEARAAGKLRLEGKEYVMQDGEVMQVRFSVS
jgi:GTP-binding protein YchF